MSIPDNQKPKQGGDRAPIRIAKLIVAHANPNGVQIPDGLDGKGLKQAHTLEGGVHGELKLEIEHRPWMRVFRITKCRRITNTVDGKPVESWIPMGRPYHLPDTWAVSVPMDDL